MKKRALLAALLALSACAADTGVAVETSAGALLVRPDPEMTRYQPVPDAPAGGAIQPFPEFGALVVTRLDGSGLPLAAREAALEALTIYCGQRGQVVPIADFSYRGRPDGSSTWSAAPCSEGPAG
ncbi:hypothetical protein [Rhodophyticola sp.]|jgi:hypothetical protein|uniref:hypothetical protein n=1 Tax=Rhodophyticola sp. TaxID=2680032 RepID=UPI003D29F06D